MASTETIVLVTKSRDAAHDALRELQRLNREGWIDLTCYALLHTDKRSGLVIRETSDKAETIRLGCPDGAVEAVQGGLQPGESALLVVVEQRYGERVAEEFERQGTTVRRTMEGSSCQAALRTSVEGIKSKVAWLEELLDQEADRATWVYGEDREKLEAGIRAARRELNAEREHLQARLLALRGLLEEHLLSIAGSGEKQGDVEEIERDIADINEDVALRILDHLDDLAAHASELRERAARASAEEEAAIGIQLSEIEVHIRRYRGELTATLASSASLVRQCLERVRGDMRQSHVKKLEQRHGLLKADIQRLERGDTRTGKGDAAGLRQAWQNMRPPLDEAMGGYR